MTEQNTGYDAGANLVDNSAMPAGLPGTQPPAPAAAPAPLPGSQPTNPNTAMNQPSATPAAPVPQQSRFGKVFDAILKGATGGDVYYTDPQGNRKLAPQSRGTMGKTILAATLAGLLSKDEYVQTPFGPRRDFAGSAGNAAQAASGVVNAARQQPQKISDEQQTKRIMTLQNNSNLIALQSAQVRLANEKNEYKLKTDADVQSMLSPVKEYEDQRTAANDKDMPQAWVDNGRGLDHEQALALAKKTGIMEANVIQDGWIDKWDATTGTMVPEPTYGILNPALKDIALPEEVTKLLAEVNSQYKDLHQYMGGQNPRVPINAYVSAMHDYQAVTQGQVILDQLSRELGGKGVTLDQVKAAARDGRTNLKNIMPALYQLNHAIAGGQMPDQRADNLLNVLLKAPNGGDVLQKLLGMSPKEAGEAAEKINNERVSKAKIAELGGISNNSPQDPAKVAQLPALAKSLGLTDAQAELAGIKAGPNGMTIGQYDTAVSKIQDQANKNEELKLRLIQQGDPTEQAKTANNLVEGDIDQVQKVTNTRGEAREKLINTIHDAAVAHGLDSTQYTQAALDNKAATYNDYNGNKKSSTGAQIGSFNAFVGHTANAVDAEKQLAKMTVGLTRTPVVNIAMDKIGKNITDSPEWKAYETALIPVQTEINNFLSAGYAVKEEDAQQMRIATDKHETPARITAALRTLAETADIRLAAIGQRYIDTMGTTYPKLLSNDSKNTMKRLGIDSKAAKLSTPVPRGWKNNQPSTATPQVMQALWAASGGDAATARELARNNGWVPMARTDGK